jgi:DNA invertase Pin-like site-specific DNA recombinase
VSAPRTGLPVAIGYVRVSTEKQGLGLDAQRSRLREWCAANKHTLAAVHIDRGVSGAAPLEKRLGLIAAIDALTPGAVFLVAKRDRIARDVIAAAMIERLVERAGGKVQAADGAGNGAGPEAQLMRRIIDAFAEYERGIIRFRTRSVLAELKAQGKRVGGVPFGSRLAADRVTLEKDDDERRTLRFIWQLRRKGESLADIAEILNRQRIPARGKRWHKTTVARLLRTMQEQLAASNSKTKGR